MVRVLDRQKSASPRGEVGEIDMRAPFQSVRAAVSLFCEVAVSKDNKPVRSLSSRRSRLSSENVIDKETQLLLAQKELQEYKKRLDGAETTKYRAQSDLDRAKRTLKDLNLKLQSVTKSKQYAIDAKQLAVAKSQEHPGNVYPKMEIDDARDQYETTVSELVAGKQQLNQIRQDFNAALHGKWASLQQASELQRLTNINKEKGSDLSRTVKGLRESYQQLKLASAQSQAQQANIIVEKDARIQGSKLALLEAEKKLGFRKKDYDPELIKNLEAKLAETNAEIENMQEEMRKAHASEMDGMKIVTTKLDEASKTLQNVTAEESSLRNFVNNLRLELMNVQREKVKLQEEKGKREIVAVEYTSNEVDSSLQWLSMETEIARREAEDMESHIEQLKLAAKNARSTAEETEKKLELAIREAEEAKAAAQRAYDDMKHLSQQGNAENSNSGKTIGISMVEFRFLKNKMEECGHLAEMKVADAMCQIEAINGKKAELEKKLLDSLTAVEEIKAATEIAVKSAESAEFNQNVVDGELPRWHPKIMAA